MKMYGKQMTTVHGEKPNERDTNNGRWQPGTLRTAGAKMCYKKLYPELSEEVRECKKSDENLV